MKQLDQMDQMVTPAPERSLAYSVLMVFGVLWPQIDVAETWLALGQSSQRTGAILIEGNPLFVAVFHSSLGLFAGLLLHVGLSLLVLALALVTRDARDARVRWVGQMFLLIWAVLGVSVIGHNGITLLLAWLNGLH